MGQDRETICKIISHMLDNPDENGIYPTTEAYDELECYVEQERMGAVGWTYGALCIALDRGNDPRKLPIPELLEKARHDLKKEYGP